MKRETASAIVLTLLIGSMLFFAISFVRAQTNAPELEVGLTSTPPIISGTYSHLPTGSSLNLTASVTNTGNAKASNVDLYLYINGAQNGSASWSTLDPSSTSSMTYTWNSPPNGNYNLTVYAPPVSGETNVANNNVTKWVRVCPDQPPTASFTWNWSPSLTPPGPVENYSTVFFDASNSSDPDRGGPTTLNYTWDFGDSNRYTTVSPFTNHIYATYGSYPVVLTVRNGENLNRAVSQTITVYGFPVAEFEVDTPPNSSWIPSKPWNSSSFEVGQYYVNETLIFNATGSYDPDHPTTFNRGIAKYTWNFGDGNVTPYTVGPIISHTYNNVSQPTNPVSLNVTDFDVLSSWTSPVNVNISLPLPVANFTPPPQPCYVGGNLTFDASASYDPKNWTAPNHGIANYTWDFNDGNMITVNSNITTHIYQNSGLYNVNLIVTDYINENSSTTLTVFVGPQLTVEDAITNSNTIIYNPGDTFNVSVAVTNVTDLYSYDLNLTWPGTKSYPIFDSVPAVVSGGFLAQGVSEIFKPETSSYGGYVWINSTRENSLSGVSGSGILATITFHVNDTMTGNCTLVISYSLLQNSTGGNIPCSLMNGSFYTAKPVANFTYYPHPPVANVTVTFDASASYDPKNWTAPNHGVANYTWDFNDGNVTTVSNSTVLHLYQDPESYSVTLNVTNYTNETWSITYPVLVTVPHVGVTNVTITSLQFDEMDNVSGLPETAGRLPVNVTVINEGTAEETFSVALYFNESINQFVPIGCNASNVSNLAPNDSEVVPCYCQIWNETWFLPPGVYNITAAAGPLPYEAQYPDINLTQGAVVVFVPGDVNRDDTTNILDGIKMGLAFDSYGPNYLYPGSPSKDNWNPNADLNGDGVINILDDIILSDNFGRHYP